MPDFSIFKNTKPSQKFIILLLTFLGFYLIVPIFFMLIAMLVWNKDIVTGGFTTETPLNYLIYLQFFTQLFVFGGAALFYSAIIEPKPLSSLGIKAVTKQKLLLIPALSILFVIPLSSWILQMSLSVSVSESWQPFMDSLKLQEDLSNNLMMRFLNVNGIGWLLFNLFFLAVIPAICEELLFRGALIGSLNLIIKNKHVVIVLSAIIFSAIHMQFFSFMSRFALGLVLGYAYVYSGSIIPAMIAHFVNNAISVITFYFSDRTNILEAGSFVNPWFVLFSSLIALLMMVWMQKIHKDEYKIEV